MHQFGLTQNQLDQIKKIIIKHLSSHSNIKVDVFGSRARGKYRQYSDLDLWIEAKPSLSIDHITKLQDEFNETDLPINIDIVTPDNVAPQYLNSILQEKIHWF